MFSQSTTRHRIISSISLCSCSLHPSLFLSSISIHLSTFVPPVQVCSLTLQADHMRCCTCAESTPAPGAFIPHRKQEGECFHCCPWVNSLHTEKVQHVRLFSPTAFLWARFDFLLLLETSSLYCSLNRCCRNYKCYRQRVDISVTWSTVAVWWGLS